MLLKLFKSNLPYVIFLIPVLGVIFWIDTEVKRVPIADDTASFTFLYTLIYQALAKTPVLYKIAGLFFLIVQSYILIRLNFKYIFIDSKTYLPSVLFLIYSSSLLQYQQLHPALLANFFLLFALNRAFVYEKKRNCLKRYYEAGWYLGMGALFYTPTIYFLSLVWITLFVLRSFNWREWISSVIGFITPIVFYASILFLTDNFSVFIGDMDKFLDFSYQSASFTPYARFALGFLIFVLFISLLRNFRFAGLKKISSRKYLSLFFWFLILLFAMLYIHPHISYELVVFFAVPVAIIQSQMYIELKKTWVAEIIFTLNLIALLTIIWFN